MTFNLDFFYGFYTCAFVVFMLLGFVLACRWPK